MKSIAFIPARYASTRFHAKLMQDLGNTTVIRRTYENTLKTQLFDDVIVVTDHDTILNEIQSHGGRAVMSSGNYESGSDRIAAVVKDTDVDIVVNVQGDEPFVNPLSMKKLIGVFEDETVQVASLMCPVNTKNDINNPSYVKVVTDRNKNALYFSRHSIPFVRNKETGYQFQKHIGIYAFRKNILMAFTRWERTPLEKTEMLEQLRYLENGVTIRMVETDEAPLSIDTPEDLEKARAYLFKLQQQE